MAGTPKARPRSIAPAPASTPQGNVIAYRFESKGFSRIDIDTNESDPRYSLAGQLMGLELASLDGFGVPGESYGFDNKLLAWETIAPLLDRGSPLRTAHLRDPVGPQIHFASESFIDELAHAAGSDPVAFRLKYLKDPRDIAVVKAAAEKANWQPRVSGTQAAQQRRRRRRPRLRLLPARQDGRRGGRRCRGRSQDRRGDAQAFRRRA